MQTVMNNHTMSRFIAHHPYPENLFECRFWRDKTATLKPDTPRITFKNIELLPQILKQPELLYDYAMLAEKLERVDLLELNMRKLISLQPDHAHAYNALGYSLADRNVRLPEARELIEKALQLSPDDPFIIDSMGWLLYRSGKNKEALEYLRKAYSTRPDPEIAAHLGEVLWAAGERGEAEKIWSEASKKTPGNEALNGTIKRFKP